MPPPALKLGLAREYRKLRPGVKPFSPSVVRRDLDFSTFEAQALTQYRYNRGLIIALTGRGLLTYGGADFSNFAEEEEK